MLIYDLGEDVDASYADRDNEWGLFENYEQWDLTDYYGNNILLDRYSISLPVNAKSQLSVKVQGIANPAFEWSSLDNSVATVDQNGMVTGVGIGETDIVVTVVGDPEFQAKCHVTVLENTTTDAKYSYGSNGEATVIGTLSDETNVVIPETTMHNGKEYTVTAISADAFRNSKTLYEITLPSTIETIPSGAFKGCKNLHTVHYGPADVSTYTGHWSNPVFEGCTSLTTIDILETVKTVPAYMFKETTIEAIVIPDNVEELGSDCFASCLKLKEIHIGKGLKKMTAANFALESGETAPSTTLHFNAASLDSYTGLGINYYPFNKRDIVKIEFGSDVESLPVNAFRECSSLNDIYCSSQMPPTLDDGCFNSTNKSSCTLHVLPGTKSLYQSAYIWKNFLNITEDATTGIDSITMDDTGSNGNATGKGIYTLSGQKMNATDTARLPKGIYIINGKKVVKNF